MDVVVRLIGELGEEKELVVLLAIGLMIRLGWAALSVEIEIVPRAGVLNEREDLVDG